MRLDVFLKTSRLIKRRTLAKEYCDEGWACGGIRENRAAS
jgi:ribosomal 50S subunit-recycling heat shock protein